jgi:hypothetical protein
MQAYALALVPKHTLGTERCIIQTFLLRRRCVVINTAIFGFYLKHQPFNDFFTFFCKNKNRFKKIELK